MPSSRSPRRRWCTALPAGLALVLAAHASPQPGFSQDIGTIERATGGVLGVAVVSAAGELLLAHNPDRRFALCSTFKLPLAAFILQRTERGAESAERRLAYGQADLLAYAPVAARYLPSGYMTVAEAMRASVQLSDNTAANLLLASVGGPAGLTAFFRSLGDEVSRLDRNEPNLNSNEAGDDRDTTSPAAMAHTIARLVWGNALGSSSREALRRLLIGNNTGDSAIRAGMPVDWLVGDKTGSCANAGRNDIAFVEPPNAAAFAIAVYSSHAGGTTAQQDEAIAMAARAASRHVGGLRGPGAGTSD